MGHTVRIDRQAVTTALEARSREPFLDLVAMLMGAQPTPEALRAFARRCPDRWAQAVANFAQLAGYSAAISFDGGLDSQLQRVSDAEVEARLTAKVAALETMG